MAEMKVSFSTYGIGPDGTDKNVVTSGGYKLTNANGSPYQIAHHSFAELYDGTALGGLPYGAQVLVTIDGHGSAVLTKTDVGTASVVSAGLPRAIDLWSDTLGTLGITDPGQGIWTGTATPLGTSAAAKYADKDSSDSGTTLSGFNAALNTALGPFFGLIGGQTLVDKMDEFAIRSVEVVMGSLVLAAGAVMFAYQMRGDASSSGGFTKKVMDVYSGKYTKDKLGGVGSRQGSSTKDVRPLTPGGSTTAAERAAGEGVATGAGEAAATGIVEDVATVAIL